MALHRQTLRGLTQLLKINALKNLSMNEVKYSTQSPNSTSGRCGDTLAAAGPPCPTCPPRCQTCPAPYALSGEHLGAQLSERNELKEATRGRIVLEEQREEPIESGRLDLHVPAGTHAVQVRVTLYSDSVPRPNKPDQHKEPDQPKEPDQHKEPDHPKEPDQHKKPVKPKVYDANDENTAF